MKKPFLLPLPALLLLAASTAAGQAGRTEPELGYLYPAGAQQGAVARVLAGGQNLRDIKSVYVSGGGVKASVVRYMGRFVRLNGEERKVLKVRITQARERIAAGLPPEKPVEPPPPVEPGGKEGAEPGAGTEGKGGTGGKGAARTGLENISRHPLLGMLHELSLEELEFVERKFLKIDPRLQPNAQIGETAMIEVSVDPDALPGSREIRLLTARGLTNPMRFEVGRLPEACEPAPADAAAGDTDPFELPVLLNGQITPGDADRFCFRAVQGQKLVIRACARRLSPFLADAVPGWFQPTLALLDARGREVAYADDYRFDPDPVLFFEVAKTGVYKIEIQDSIFRGRDDFVYRISVSMEPFITSLFPLGGRIGEETMAFADGWNLASPIITLDTGPGPGRIRGLVLEQEGGFSNRAAYAVDDLPEILKAEPNDALGEAAKVALPAIVNGIVARPGDRDRFLFEGRAGDVLVAEVTARRLDSPLDSLVRLISPSGKVIAWNDDSMRKQGHLHAEIGVLTHHADSYLAAMLPEDGVYCAEVTDAQGRGGPDFGYRLRISPPMGDFELAVTPSTLNLEPGRAAVIRVHALRKDGFDGEIEAGFADSPEGFELQGNVIPSGRDQVRMTVTAPARRFDAPVRLRILGRAVAGGREIKREAVAADDLMQAFLWRHLVPAGEFVVAVMGKGGRERVALLGKTPVRVPLGGSVTVRMRTPMLPVTEGIQLELSEAPAGVGIADVKFMPRRVEFMLTAAEGAVAAGFADNLIVSAFLDRAPDTAKGGKAAANRAGSKRVLVGVLPAIPIKIVKKDE